MFVISSCSNGYINFDTISMEANGVALQSVTINSMNIIVYDNCAYKEVDYLEV